MNKRQFLKELEEELGYELPSTLVRSNLDYYSSYIDGERQKGRGEDEILSDLGDPRLIARTIIDAAKSGSDGIPNTPDDRDFTDQIYGGSRSFGQDGAGYREEADSAYGRDSRDGSFGDSGSYGSGGSSGDMPRHHRNIDVYHNFGCLGFLVTMLVIMLIFSFIGTALSVLLPILGPLIIVMIIIWIFTNMRGDQ